MILPHSHVNYVPQHVSRQRSTSTIIREQHALGRWQHDDDMTTYRGDHRFVDWDESDFFTNCTAPNCRANCCK